jgi:hypothetical protein
VNVSRAQLVEITRIAGAEAREIPCAPGYAATKNGRIFSVIGPPRSGADDDEGMGEKEAIKILAFTIMGSTLVVVAAWVMS